MNDETNTHINTQGGSVVSGGVTAQTFIGRDQIVVNSLSDVYKPYLIGMIDDLSHDFENEPYVPLSGYTRELPSQHSDIAHALQESIVHYKNLFDVLKKYSQFVLLGDPGSGKTHTLKFMALQVAKRCLETNFQSPLPLLIDLSSWDGEDTFESFITNHWEVLKKLPGKPLKLIAQGAILLFLDGLNEMGAMGRERVKNINQWLLSFEFQKNKNMVFACKKHDYLNKDLELEIIGFPEIFITELSEKQIVQFVHAYLEEPELFLDQYTNEQTSSSLRLPYTLSRLALLYRHGVKYIKNPGALNHILVKSLWIRATKDKGTAKKRTILRNTDGDENNNIVFFMLGQLAMRLLVGQKPLSFDRKFIVDTFSAVIAFADSKGESIKAGKHYLEHAEDILADALQLGLLISDGSKMKFPHQLLSEYFVARMLWESKHRGVNYPFEQVKYEDERSLMTLDFANRHSSRFESVFVQIFGIVAATNEKELELLIYEILKISSNPFLVTDCVTNTGINIEPVFKRIIVYELFQKYLFILFGQSENDDFLFSAQDLEILRSGLRHSTQFGIFPAMVREFSVYISKIMDDSCFDLLTGLIGQDICVDQGIMLGLALSGKSGLDFFIDFLNDDNNDYFVRSRIARCILELPSEKKYAKGLNELASNQVHTFGDGGVKGGRLTIGKLATQKLSEIDALSN